MEKRCSGKEGGPHWPVITVFHFIRRERLRQRGHILDLVITRNETEGALGLKNVTVMEQFISDHKAVCFNLNLRKPLNERRQAGCLS